MHNDTTHPPQQAAAIETRQWIFADVAAQDPKKLGKAVRIVVAALAMGRLSMGDLRRELDTRTHKAS